MKLYVAILCFLICAVHNTIAGELSLSSGWNLITVPLVDSSSDIATYLQANLKEGTVKKIWNYDGGWKSYTPDASSNLTDFQQNRGYWFLMDSLGGKLSYSDSAGIKGVEFQSDGWALASFNQSRDLDSITEVFLQDNIKSNHSLSNIAKVWGYSGSWKSFTPDAIGADGGSGDLSSLAAGSGFWFLLKNLGGENLELSPKGAVGSELIIGGATSLTPPDTAVSPSISRVAFSRFSTVAAHSTHSSADTSSIACDAGHKDRVIGYATAFSLSGKALNNPNGSPIKCNFDSQNNILPVTYQIRFTSEEQIYLQTNPLDAQNIVVSVELNSGQEMKSILPDQLSDRVQGKASGSVDATVDESSSLSVALLALEIANKLGVPEDQFKLGEQNAGLGNLSAEVVEVVRKNEVDIEGFSQLAQSALTSIDSPFRAIAAKIKEINDPSNLDLASGVLSKTDELSSILSGKSSQIETSDFLQKLSNAKTLASKGSQLLAKQKSARVRGILNQDQESKLSNILSSMVSSEGSDEGLLDVVDVISDSLSLAEATSGTHGIEELVLSKLDEVVTTVAANIESLKGSQATSKSLGFISKAMSYPQDLVIDLASNINAARSLGSIFGKASTALKKAQQQEALDGMDLLTELDTTVSVINGSVDLLDTLVKNAPDTDTVSEILAGAVEATSSNTSASDDLFNRISSIKSEVESAGEIEVDFSAIMQKSIGKAKNLKNLAKNLAKNSDNASAALAVLAEASSALTTSDLESVLFDEKLQRDFALSSRLFVSAGRSQKFEYSANNIEIKLDARNSFDPLAQSLSYQWFSVDEIGSESVLIGATAALSMLNVSNLIGKQTRSFKVKVTAADGREGNAVVKHFFFAELEPIILAPRFVQTKINQPIIISARNSFDPKTGQSDTLSFAWSFTNPNVTIQNQDTHTVSLQSAVAGSYEGILTVSRSQTSFSTQLIRVRVQNVQPPVADAGFVFLLNQSKLIRDGGVKLDNYSFSMQTGLETGLSYVWEPAAYFSTEINENATQRNPRFIVSEAGSYRVTLTVTENGLSSSDELSIIVRPGRPPFVFAGVDQVIELDNSVVDLNLDGSGSFSYNTGTPNYKWSGPLSFYNSSETSATAIVKIDPNDFTDRALLQFNLAVSDQVGIAYDDVIVAVIPKTRPPHVVINTFPAKSSYSAGDIISLDASLSFANTAGNLSYEWTNLSGLTLISDNASLQSSKILMQIPQVSEVTNFKLKLSVTDQNQKTSHQIIELRAKPAILPPVAIVRPSQIVLEDSDQPVSVRIDASSSYSRGGGVLSYQWDLDPTLISIKSTSLSSSILKVQAPNGALSRQTYITLKITDSTGLTDHFIIPVLIKSKPQSVKKLEVEAFFAQNISASSFRENPYFDQNKSMYVFEEAGEFNLFGFVYDPNEVPQSASISVELYEWGTSTLGSLIQTFAPQINPINSAKTQFVVSAPLPVAGSYAILINAKGLDSSIDSTNRIIFEVPQNQVITANLIISSIQSLSSGFIQVSSDTYQDSFIDQEILVDLKADFDGRNAAHPVEYLFSYDWVGNTDSKIFLQKVATDRVSARVPIPIQTDTINFQVRVKDLISSSISDPVTASLVLNRVNLLPPVANPSSYPEFQLTAGQNSISVKLNALGSLSPNGNSLNYEWSYLGVGDVFGTGSNFIQTAVVDVLLSEGEHTFQLAVTDSLTGLNNTKFVTIMVKPVDIPSLDYIVDGDLIIDPYQIEGALGDLILNLNVIRLNPEAPISNGFLKFTIYLDNQLFSDELHQIGANFQKNLGFLSLGNHNIFVSAFYDHDKDGFPDERSINYQKEITITVVRDVRPLIVNISDSITELENTIIDLPNSESFSSPLTLSVNLHNPNTFGSWNEVTNWTDKLEISAVNVKNTQAVSIISGQSTTYIVSQSTVRSADVSSAEYPFLVALPVGDLDITAQVQSIAVSGEIATGVARRNYWVRQTPDQFTVQPATHALNFEWGAVEDSSKYILFIKPTGESENTISIETIVNRIQIPELPSNNYEAYLETYYSNLPVWVTSSNSYSRSAVLTAKPLNNMPQANQDNFTIEEDSVGSFNVLTNDLDSDGDPLSITQFSQPNHGSLTLNDANFEYSPRKDYNGTDSFEYEISDSYGGYSTAVINIQINNVNDAPKALDDSFSYVPGVPIVLDVLANDSDIDSQDQLQIVSFSGPSAGTLEISSNQLIFSNGGSQEIFFDYTIADLNGVQVSATVHLIASAIVIPDLNPLVIAGDGQATVSFNSPSESTFYRLAFGTSPNLNLSNAQIYQQSKSLRPSVNLTGLTNGTYFFTVGFEDNSEISEVYHFDLNPNFGRLNFQKVYVDNVNGFDGLLRVQNLTFSKNGERLYSVSAFASNQIEDNSVALYNRSTSSGDLSVTSYVFDASIAHGNPPQEMRSPRDIVFNQTGNRAYLASYDHDSISKYFVTTYGELSHRAVLGFSDANSLNGVQQLTISPDGKDLYAVGRNDGDSSDLAGVTVIDLTNFTVTQSITNSGDFIGLWPTKVLVSPSGSHVYVNSVSPGKIWIFERNLNTGQLSLSSFIDQSIEASLAGIQSMAISVDGEYLYTVSKNPGDAILVFQILSNGSLELLQKLDTTDIAVIDDGTDINISPDSMSVYATDNDGITVLRRDLHSGLLTFEEHLKNSNIGDTGLEYPIRVKISPDGRNVYVVDEYDHAISQFSRTGAEASSPTTLVVPNQIAEITRVSLEEGALISWSKVSTADRYTVYQSTAPGIDVNNPATYDSRTIVFDLDELQINNLTNEVKYYFRITGSNFKGEGAPSDEFSVTPSTIQVVGLCDLARLQVQPSTTSLIISVTTTENADNFNISWNTVLGAAKYDLNLSNPEEDGAFSWTLNGIVDTKQSFFYDQNATDLQDIGASQWAYYLARNGKLWEIEITAKDSQNQILTTAMARVRVGTPQPTQVIAHGVSSDSQVEIQWCDSQNASSYIIHHGISNSNLNNSIPILDSVNSKIITQLFNNTEYYFAVEAVNDDGHGVFSEKIKITPGSNLTPDFSIESVTFNQGVQLDLTSDVSSTPAIAGKTGILRVFINSMGAVNGRKVKVRLGVTRNNLPLLPIVKEEVIFDGSKAASEEYSFPVFFELSGEYVDAGNTFTVFIDPNNEIIESNENNNSFPQVGERSFGLTEGHTIRIRVVPIVVSGRSADLDSNVIKQLKDYMVSMYPNAHMNVELRQSITLPSSQIPNADTGWDTTLDQFEAFRINDISSNEQDIFYYGVFKNMTDEAYQANGGGLAGLGYVNEQATGAYLSSIGLRFDNVFLDTAAHEIGHNHGRDHVASTGEFNDNCSIPNGPDLSYPYQFGRIQKMGYDFVKRRLYSGYAYHDIMSYCDRVWISDYTYKKLWEFQNALHAEYTIPQASISRVNLGRAKEIRFLDRPEGLNLTSVREIDFTGLIQGPLELVALTASGVEVVGSATRKFMDHSISTSIIGRIPTNEKLVKLQLWDGDSLLFEEQSSSYSMQKIGVVDWLEQSGNDFLIRKGSNGRRIVRLSTDGGNVFRVIAFDNNDKDLWFSAKTGDIVEIQFHSGINVFTDRKVIQ